MGIQLSLAALHGVRNQIGRLFVEDDPEPRVQEVVMYRCTECGDTHDFERHAEECCPVEERPVEPHYLHCPVCGTRHGEAYESASCCLWKDLTPAERHRIAFAVMRGGTWEAELGVSV